MKCFALIIGLAWLGACQSSSVRNNADTPPPPSVAENNRSVREGAPYSVDGKPSRLVVDEDRTPSAGSHLTFVDRIRSVKGGKDLQVTFWNHAAVYKVSTNQASFNALKNALMEGLRAKRSLTVVVDSGSLEILEIRDRH